MQYSRGQVGRVFMVRTDDGEDFIREIRRSVAVTNSMIHVSGTARAATIAAGSEESTIPPSPRNEELFGGWEQNGVDLPVFDRVLS